jgi:hypothetical protein
VGDFWWGEACKRDAGFAFGAGTSRLKPYGFPCSDDILAGQISGHQLQTTPLQAAFPMIIDLLVSSPLLLLSGIHVGFVFRLQ